MHGSYRDSNYCDGNYKENSSNIGPCGKFGLESFRFSAKMNVRNRNSFLIQMDKVPILNVGLLFLRVELYYARTLRNSHPVEVTNAH